MRNRSVHLLVERGEDKVIVRKEAGSIVGVVYLVRSFLVGTACIPFVPPVCVHRRGVSNVVASISFLFWPVTRGKVQGRRGHQSGRSDDTRVAAAAIALRVFWGVRII